MAAAQNIQHVLNGSATRRGYHSYPAREGWNRLLAAGIKQSLCRKFGLQLLEGDLQSACALGFEVLSLELEVAALVVDRHPAARDDLQPVVRAEAQQPSLRAPHHHAQLGRAILQREVQVTGTSGPVIRD